MKSFIIVLLFFISTSIVFAQTVEREVISSNGNFYSNGAGQLSTTLGEPIISTVNSASNILTQGFHQTLITITAIEDNQAEYEMNIYPNPTSENITIKIKELKEDIQYTIYTISGKLVSNNQIIALETKLSIAHFARGQYFLNVIEENKIIKTYQIIKQ
jgi:Secretion system C-terminal sorting domain